MKTGVFSRDASSGGGAVLGHGPEESIPCAHALPSSPDAKIRPFSKVIWQVIPAGKSHIPAIAADMRQEDAREVWASHRHSPEQALEYALARSELAWTCFVENAGFLPHFQAMQPVFMWGVARIGSLLSGRGAPWLLGTPALLRVSREFLRQCPAYVARMQERFPRLENFVHAENRLSIRWLAWCGFTVADRPERINGEDFFKFWRGEYV